jgi:hypothetical protein
MENQGTVTPLQQVGPTADGRWNKPWAAFNIIDRPGMKNRIWSRIGTAWLNRDGSINLVLDSIPLGGRINIREDDRERRSEARGALAVAAETPQDAG